jgi:hypothetical protein
VLVLLLVIMIESLLGRFEQEHEHEHEHEWVEGAESDVIPRLAERDEGPPTR